MDQLIWAMMICGLFLVLILLAAIALVLFIKNWTEKRDAYYNDQMKSIRENVAEMKEGILQVLNHLK